MKKIIGLSLPVVTALMFAACGDDVTNSDLVKAESFASEKDLPQCGTSYDGRFAVIPSKGEVFVCSKDETDGYKWTKMGGAAAKSEGVKLDCKAEELADKSGIKVVCNGDSLAVIKNGKPGETPTVESCTVETLADSSGVKVTCGDKSVEVKNGAVVVDTGSSSTVTPEKLKNEESCEVIYSGADILVYDCDGRAYTAKGNAVDFPTWKGLSRSVYVYGNDFDPGRRVVRGSLFEDYLAMWDFDDEEGAILWEGLDPEESADLTANPMVKSLMKNYGLVGKALLNVNSPGDENVSLELDFTDGNGPVASWGGFCLTYSATEDMKIYIGNEGFGTEDFFATLPATAGKEKTTNITWNKFRYVGSDAQIPESEWEWIFNVFSDYSGDSIGIQAVRIALVEGFVAGSHENNFGVYEIGAYGKCSGKSINKIKANLAAQKKTGKEGKYNTVTIGTQTWLAENLNEQETAEEKTFDSATSETTTSIKDQYTCLDGTPCKNVAYTWKQAMGYLGDTEIPSDIPVPAQGLCPEGWHVPSLTEWKILWAYVSKEYMEEAPARGLDFDDYQYNAGFASKVLLSTDEWPEDYAGWDLLGFGLKPNYVDKSKNQYESYMWTSTGYYNVTYVYNSDGYFGDNGTYTHNGENMSVRCVKTEAGVDYEEHLR